MTKYILVIFSLKDASSIYQKIESLLAKGDKYNTMQMGTLHLISFITDLPLDSIKKDIEEVYSTPPLFIIFDSTHRGETFDMNFGKLEPTLLLEAINFEPTQTLLSEVVETSKKPNEKDKYELNELLELVFKNGYDTLTERQKEQLKKYSDEN